MISGGIWAHLLKKSLMENFIFCAVLRLPKLHESVHKASVGTDSCEKLNLMLEICLRYRGYLKFQFAQTSSRLHYTGIIITKSLMKQDFSVLCQCLTNIVNLQV